MYTGCAGAIRELGSAVTGSAIIPHVLLGGAQERRHSSSHTAKDTTYIKLRHSTRDETRGHNIRPRTQHMPHIPLDAHHRPRLSDTGRQRHGMQPANMLHQRRQCRTPYCSNGPKQRVHHTMLGDITAAEGVTKRTEDNARTEERRIHIHGTPRKPNDSPDTVNAVCRHKLFLQLS